MTKTFFDKVLELSICDFWLQ